MRFAFQLFLQGESHQVFFEKQRSYLECNFSFACFFKNKTCNCTENPLELHEIVAFTPRGIDHRYYERSFVALIAHIVKRAFTKNYPIKLTRRYRSSVQIMTNRIILRPKRTQSIIFQKWQMDPHPGRCGLP